MTDAIVATAESHALAPIVPENKRQLLKDVIARGCTDGELELFVTACERLRLDPFMRQIHPVKRWQDGREVMSIQVGIDGYRSIAQRTGEFDGEDEFQWCGPDGVWTNVWLSDEPPVAARARVYRKGVSHAPWVVARYDAYVQLKKDGKPNSMWAKRAPEQLAKCAESLAFRMQFQELSGTYTDEEMAQADNEQRPQVHATATQDSKRLASNTQERKSEPPPASAEPCFSRKFPDKHWAGQPLSAANGEVLSDYAAWLEALIKDPKQAKAHEQARKALDDTAAALDAILASEATKAPSDDIAEGLQRHIDDRDAGEQQPDGWGLTP